MNVFIVNRDRLHSPKRMVEHLQKMPNVNVVILDSASTYEPLLEWYETKPCIIEREKLNWGECILWRPETGFIEKYHLHQGDYCVTDGDLRIDKLPLDFHDILKEGLRKYPQYDKCGLSLEIRNLPQNAYTQEIIKHESAYWGTPVDSMYFDAPIDTTYSYFASQIHSFKIS